MSLGINLRGRRTETGDAASWLNEVASWAATHAEDYLELPPRVWEFEGQRGVAISLHPCAEAVAISVTGDEEVEVIANTSSAGPGYHQYLCAFLDDLAGSFGVEWLPPDEGEGDETGYFESRDRAALEKQMLRWLAALTEQLASHEDVGDSVAVCMSVDHHFDAGSAIVTPLGPRSREWAEATSRTPASGAGFFAWWDEGDTGRSRRDRALARMWATILWAEPRSEEEATTIALTLRDLGVALELDPDLDMPWREWLELSSLVGEDPPAHRLIKERAAAATGPLVGYRRRPVRVLLPGGWRVVIPGGFSETFQDDGAFLAWDQTRNIRVSTFAISGHEHHGHVHDAPSPEEMLEDDPDAQLPPAIEELERWSNNGVIGAGKIYRDEEDGEEYRVLMGKVAAEGRMALCTACYADDAHRDWAIETWKSLR